MSDLASNSVNDIVDLTMVTLLLVDLPLSDADAIGQTLGDADYVAQTLQSDAASAQDHIQYKPLDLIFAPADLTLLQSLRDTVEACGNDIPIIAIVDGSQAQKTLALLQAGADNFFERNEEQHLLLVAKRELNYLALRRRANELAQRVEEIETRSHALLASTPDAIAYIHEGVHSYANPTYLNLFGYSNEDELAAIPFINMVAAKDRDTLKKVLRACIKTGKPQPLVSLTGLHSDNTELSLRLECSPTRIDGEPCLQVVMHEPKQDAQRQQIAASGHDEYTGLYSRKMFVEHLAKVCQAESPGGGLIYILLTDYRNIIERLGLIAIDQLLRDIAELLKSKISDNEVIGRVSDAAFVIYTTHSDSQAILTLAQQLSEAIKNHTSHAVKTLVHSASALGIYHLQAGDSETEALARVDQACSIARQEGSNTIYVYGTEQASNKKESATAVPDAASATSSPEGAGELETVLREAITNNRMKLLYQPIASFQDGTVERYEAYLQVYDEKNEPITQQLIEFAAESSNLMWQLDRWVIVQVLDMLSKRYQQQQGLPTLFTSISGNSIIDDTFCSWLKRRLDDSGLPGSILVLEVKEETAEQHFEKLRPVRDRIKNIGCDFALSQFGNHSNSQYLFEQLQPDYIKIDSQLFEKLAKVRDDKSRRLLTQMTEKARAANSEVVASDISSAPQMASLWQFGITVVQGDMVQEPRSELDFNFRKFVAG